MPTHARRRALTRPGPDVLSAPLTDPTLDFLRLLWGVEHGLQSTSKRMEDALGITGPQRLVLKIVSQFPGLSARDLAHIVRLHPSTVTGILQRLVGKGLLTRRPDPIDGRRVQLRVRARARRFTGRAAGTIESAVERALANVSGRQLGHARQVLSAIVEALEQHRR
jgi:MarR family transcriptional regulator, organic hydroperoxide resistance regulator